MIGEGLIVGLVASAIGIAAGIGTAVALRAVLGAFGANRPGVGDIVAYGDARAARVLRRSGHRNVVGVVEECSDEIPTDEAGSSGLEDSH